MVLGICADRTSSIFFTSIATCPRIHMALVGYARLRD